jgi:hypothetical protein
MIVAALSLLLGRTQRAAYTRLEFSPHGILFQIEVREGERTEPEEPSFAKVVVKGPDGDEPVHLTKMPPMGGGEDGPARIDVDRSPRAGWRTMSVDITKVPSAKCLGGAKETYRYYLPAQDSAASDDVLRKKWIGKPVWLLGSSVWQRDKNLMWDPREAVTIVDIKRIPGPILSSCGYPVWNAFDGWNGGSFLCGGALNVTVRSPRNAWTALAVGPTANTVDTKDRHRAAEPATGGIWLADGWQIERVFRITSPAEILRGESAKVRKAFANRELVNGMPRSLAAYLVGDPEPSSPVGEVWRRKIWEWIGTAPFTFVVAFDQAGRISDFGTQGRLP